MYRAFFCVAKAEIVNQEIGGFGHYHTRCNSLPTIATNIATVLRTSNVNVT
jgi:hypothetical protein